MRPKKSVEKFVRVRKPNLTTSPQMDKRTLDDSFTAMEQTMRTKSAEHEPSARRIIIRSRMTKLTAAAAMIILAIGLIVTYLGPGRQVDTAKIPKITKSPADLVTAAALTVAYRRGGLEAVERQCEKAVQVLGTTSASVSLRDLLEDLNG